MIPRMNMAFRQVMNHLRSGEWKRVVKFSVLVSDYEGEG